MELNFATATRVTYGGQNATRIYLGSTRVWPAPPPTFNVNLGDYFAWFLANVVPQTGAAPSATLRVPYDADIDFKGDRRYDGNAVAPWGDAFGVSLATDPTDTTIGRMARTNMADKSTSQPRYGDYWVNPGNLHPGDQLKLLIGDAPGSMYQVATITLYDPAAAPAPYVYDMSDQGRHWEQVTRTIRRADDESAGKPALVLAPRQQIRWTCYKTEAPFGTLADLQAGVAVSGLDLTNMDSMAVVPTSSSGAQQGVGTWANGGDHAPIFDNNLWTPPADCAGKTYWLRFGLYLPLPPPFDGVTEGAVFVRIVYST